VGRVTAPPDARIPWPVVILRGVDGATGAQATIAIPGRALLDALAAILEEETAQPITIDVKADDIDDVIVDPRIDVDVLRVTRDGIGEARTAQVGEEVKEVIPDVIDLDEAARVARRRRHIRMNELDGRGRGGNPSDQRWSKLPFIRIGAVDLQQVTAGERRQI